VAELWRKKGGAYNVESVLRVMVRGLQKELKYESIYDARVVMKRLSIITCIRSERKERGRVKGNWQTRACNILTYVVVGAWGFGAVVEYGKFRVCAFVNREHQYSYQPA
jgi:hypothetical protein